MKLAVIGANGKVGRRIVEEALKQGVDVSAIARKKNDTKAKNFIDIDIFDLNYADLEPFDVIVDAFGTWAPETLVQHSLSLKHLSDILSHKPNRLLVVGGAGSLFLDDTHRELLMESESFPDDFKPLATNMAKGFNDLKKRKDVNWTYISPSENFVAEGERIGTYQLGGDALIYNANGKSEISYADYALALVDVALSDKYNQQRISVGSL